MPAHLDQPTPEPVVVLEEIKTRGDERRLLGDYVTWGRTVAAKFKELRRLIDVFNTQETPAPK